MNSLMGLSPFPRQGWPVTERISKVKLRAKKQLVMASMGLMAMLGATQACAGFVYHVNQTVFGNVNFDATFLFSEIVTVDTTVPLSAATQVLVNAFDAFNGVEFDLDSSDSLVCQQQTGGASCDVVRFNTAAGGGSSFAFDLGEITNPGLYSRTTGQVVGTLEITQTNDVPEPAGWALASAALGGLAWVRRRRTA
jgi:MYXO-CTERM domain-containing protein